MKFILALKLRKPEIIITFLYQFWRQSLLFTTKVLKKVKYLATLSGYQARINYEHGK